MVSTVGVIFSSINDENIPELTKIRSIASIPFGGRYRLVDFSLSNMVNSGITTVGLITRNNYQSLMDHLGSGKHWDLARKEGGLILLPPYSGNTEVLYKNRLEALMGATNFLRKAKGEYVVLADSDAVYKFDYSKMVDYHIAKGADITMAYHEAPIEKSRYYITFDTNADERITGVAINPATKGTQKLYMNIMVARTSFLLNLVEDAIVRGYKSFGRDILSQNLDTIKFYGYKFDGYYRAMTSLNTYFNANLELLEKDIRTELFGERDIYTKVHDSVPAKLTDTSLVVKSLIADGCFIEGTVENCVLFRGVRVGKGAVVKNCVILPDTIIGENCHLDYLVTDKQVVIRKDRVLAGCELQPYFISKGTLL